MGPNRLLLRYDGADGRPESVYDIQPDRTVALDAKGVILYGGPTYAGMPNRLPLWGVDAPYARLTTPYETSEEEARANYHGDPPAPRRG